MLTSRFGQNLDPAHVLDEYPRPQLKRERWRNLNGYWDYAITATADTPAAWDGQILVPFSPETELSGVRRTLQPKEYLWYSRPLALPDGFFPDGQRLLLHFGAVDREADVFVNGSLVGQHIGGYNAFTIDITDALQANENQLTVRVTDNTDESEACRGKQSSKPKGIWYHAQSGIWQTVWMEVVPKDHVEALCIMPHVAAGTVEITVETQSGLPCTVSFAGKTYPATPNEPVMIPVASPELWSPEHPKLYDFTVQQGDDIVSSYFALRDIAVGPDAEGKPRLLLNGKPYFHNGLLDQGYWPESLYTPPSDEAMIFDIQTAKDLGYNMLRKHIKVEPMRWYYHCDRLGMLVWQDMPSGGGRYRPDIITLPLILGNSVRDNRYAAFSRRDSAERTRFLSQLDEMVRQLRSCPCIVLWVPFNEGWGQFDAAGACERIRKLDPSRVIDHASGWHDQGCGDFKSLHVYFRPYRFRPDRRGRAVILSEFGGYTCRIEEHVATNDAFGYKKTADSTALTDSLQKLYEEQVLPAIDSGLAACVYTQLTDVETEINGILTWDRMVIKPDVDRLLALNRKINSKY